MRQLKTARRPYTAVGAAAFTLVGATAASAASSTVYVSRHGHAGASDRSRATARYRHINQAIHAAPRGGTGGRLRWHLQGAGRGDQVAGPGLTPCATIDAKGQKPISKKLPGGSGVVVFGAKNVEVTGFTVKNAGFDAILVARSRRVLVSHNLLKNNGDVGVDFNGSSDSLATHNLAEFNQGGGFLIADDLGPTHFDPVTWDKATRNPGGCGVIIAGHSTAGVWGNYVAHNLITFNGLNHKQPGAGVVIATEVKGERVSDNDVADNEIYGNGLAGVTIHSHVPGQRMSGNQIVGNDIGKNNIVGDTIGLAPPVTNHPDLRTTGILVGASSAIRVWIHGNYIHSNWFGIYLNGRIRAHIYHNRYHRVHKHIKVA